MEGINFFHMGVIPSIYDQLIKFPTKNVVKTVHRESNQPTSRNCYDMQVKNKQKFHTQPIDNLELPNHNESREIGCFE